MGFVFSEFQIQFFKRINYKIPSDNIKFEDIQVIMGICSETFSFENLDIINNQIKTISRQVIIQELLLNNSGSGGLCYKLNGLFYYFLKECGFNVHLSLGTVVVGLNPWGSLDNHVVIILNYNGNNYLIDIGFGLYLSLAPILILNNNNHNNNSSPDNNNNNSSLDSNNIKNGADNNADNNTDNNIDNSVIIKNKNGLFKIINETNSGKKSNGEIVNYTHTFQFKKDDNYLIEKDRDWVSGYVFNLNKIDSGNEDTCLNIIQHQIIRDKLAIAQIPMAVKLTNNGLSVLTINNLTFTNYNGEKTITPIESVNQFNEYLFKLFQINNYIQS